MTSATGRDALYSEVMRQVQSRNWREADARCRNLTAANPEFAPGWLLASVVAQHLDEHERALQLAERAVAAAPNDASALLRQAQCLDGLRRRPEALRVAALAEHASRDDPRALAAIGLFYSAADEQFLALAAYDRACRQAPDNARLLFSRAVLRRNVGRLEEAEADYDRVLELDPKHYESYTNRSNLRSQTPDRNHVGLLEELLERGDAGAAGEVQLCYALAKEYADLGRHAESWARLERGAWLRHRQLTYDINVDLDTVAWLIEAYPAGPLQPTPGAPANAPIFIVGLPRAGSTLVERILSSHSQVHAAGELRHFTLAIAAAARAASGLDAPPLKQVIALSPTFDFAALGHDYLARCRPVAGSARRFIDKMPINYLHCGLIRRALPNARIVHIARRPLAACYAMYKMLFRDGYPFSYDLDETAQYYIAYRRLMDHWQRTMPGVIHELSYERLVADQRGETRRLLEFCALEWEDACLDFHLNPAASTSASAHQVRRPIYDSAVNEWRDYATQLAGLRARLASAGVCEDERMGPRAGVQLTGVRPVRAVLFDLDGTLVDSEIHSDQSISAALAQYGVADFRLPHTDTQGRTWIYIAGKIKERAKLDHSVEQIAADLLAHWNDVATDVKPIPGAPEAVRAAAARNLKLGVVSSSPRSVIDSFLDKLGVDDCIDRSARIGGDAVRNTKPDPEGYLLAARALSVDPADTLVFEDSRAGLMAAKAAGMRSVFVTCCASDIESNTALATTSCTHYRALPPRFWDDIAEGGLDLANRSFK